MIALIAAIKKALGLGSPPRPASSPRERRFPIPAADGEIKPGAYNATGYHAADVLRKSGRTIPAGGTADRHARLDRELLVQEALRLDRDNATYKGLLERSLDAILGRDGFTLQFGTGDPSLNADLEARWRGWARAPEVRGIFDWRDCERLALRAILNCGDVGVVRTNARQVRYVESEQIRSQVGSATVFHDPATGNRVEQGVELDEADRPIAYWIARYSEHGFIQPGTSERIDAIDFVLAAYRERFSQTRGIPALAHAMPLVHRLNDILDSEAIAWQQLARFSVAFSWPGSSAASVDLSTQDQNRTQPPDIANRYLEHEAGTFFFGEPGESVSGVKREIPGANFSASVQTFLRLLGMSFGLPYSVLSLDYSQTTYTSSRAELEQAFRMFIRRQRDLIRHHHDPITRWWLDWQLAAGEVPQRRDYAWAWVAPEFPWIDQLKEAQAWGVRLDRGLATQGDALRSLGIEHADWLEARKAEVIAARKAAIEVNAETPELPEANWKIFAGLPISVVEPAEEAEAREDIAAAEQQESA